MYSYKDYKAVNDLAKKEGFRHSEFIGLLEGFSIFLVSKGNDGGKVGYPNYIAVKDGHARMLTYEERKKVTFEL